MTVTERPRGRILRALADPAPQAPPGEAGAVWIERALLLAAAVLLLGRVAFLANRYLLVDDAFISFRYADNLAHGAGLVYNPGERVEGYTNFLWTVLLAAGVRCGLEPGVLSVALSLLAALATLPLLLHLARWLLGGVPHAAALAGLCPLLYAAMASQARFVLSGLETLSFALLVVLATDLSLARGRPVAGGVTFAAAAMTRPEGILYWALALGSCWLLRRSRHGAEPSAGRSAAGRWGDAIALAVPFLVLYGGYFLWRASYYGHLLPNTFYAKAADPTWERFARGGRLLAELASRCGLYPLVALALIGLAPGLPGRSERTPALLWAWSCVLATAGYFVLIGGDFLVFFGPRLLLPGLAALLVLAALGLARLLPPRRSGRLVTLTLAGLLLVGNALWFCWPARFSRLSGQAFQLEAWSRLGRWLADSTPAGATVATGAAGAIAYYSRRFTLDMFGLTDDHIAHLGVPAGTGDQPAHEKYDPVYILLRRPDVVVSTRIDDSGRPLTAGLGTVQREVEACYQLAAVLKSRRGPPAAGRWIVPVPPYSPELADDGYGTGIYLLRRGPRAARCAQLLAGLEQGPRP